MPCILDQETRRENLIFTLYTLILKCYTNTQITHSKLKWSLGPKDKRESCDCWVFWLSRTLLGRCLQCPLRFSFSVACGARLPSFLRVLEHVAQRNNHCVSLQLSPIAVLPFLPQLLLPPDLQGFVLFLFLIICCLQLQHGSIAGSSGFIHCCVLRMMPTIDPQESGQTKWAVSLCLLSACKSRCASDTRQQEIQSANDQTRPIQYTVLPLCCLVYVYFLK